MPDDDIQSPRGVRLRKYAQQIQPDSFVTRRRAQRSRKFYIDRFVILTFFTKCDRKMLRYQAAFASSPIIPP